MLFLKKGGKKKTALFGRDRFGKKPLFYSLIGNNKLVFASEMKGIYPFLNSIQPSEKINTYLQKNFNYESSENQNHTTHRNL